MNKKTNKDLGVELNVLHHITHALLHKKNIPSLLREVLDVLKHDMGLDRGTLTLKRDNLLFIEASEGLTKKEIERGQYKIGEGITGEVAKTGKSELISDISKDKRFLDRTKARRSIRIAFICVPIKHNGEIIGTLSIDHPLAPKGKLLRLLRLLETVSAILAEAVASFRIELQERDELRAENERLKMELSSQYKPNNIVGNCSIMRNVYTQIAQVASSPATVLIRGESGTGKELVAKAVHYASQRKNAPFIAVNCAALPENLIESELFGHEKGAFTGAHQRRKGRFEVANGGTLFLDEIGDINLSVQVKLLRVLQEKVFERIGGHNQLNANVRVIAATSRNLEEKIASGEFRDDLFYRLNIFPIHLPALRERKSDIMLLADHFLVKYNEMYNKSIRRISTPAINMIMSYHWPGNVRELENCIERAVLMSTNNVINAYDMPPSLQTATETGTEIVDQNADLQTMVTSFERELIVDSLKRHRGNVAAAARSLGSTQRIIHYKLSRLDIDPKRFR